VGKPKQNKPQNLPELFRALDIDFSKPGFYDTPAFGAAERRDPSFLAKYADFVDGRAMSPEEISHARVIVPKAAQFLFERLAQAQHLDACANASMALSRFLERQGVWNYVVKGALTVSFADDTGSPPVHIAPIGMKRSSHPDAFPGHAWVCAPPFRVVDVTVALQKPYTPAARAILGDFFVAAETVQPATPAADDLFDSECVAEYRHRRGSGPTLRDVTDYNPRLLDKIKRYGAFLVTRDRVALKYVGYDMTAPGEPLEDPTVQPLGGKRPIELYHDFVATLGG
jgi:hypothetical protein